MKVFGFFKAPLLSPGLMHIIGFVFVFLCLHSSPMAAAPLAFSEGSWKQIVKTHTGKPHIVHFWGVTCGPCVEELKEWAQFMQKYPGIALILVQTDEATPAQAEQILQKANLEKLENWSLSAYLSDPMRYEIDPGWVGELPYTRLTDSKGKTLALRGTVDFNKVEEWLEHTVGKDSTSPAKSSRK